MMRRWLWLIVIIIVGLVSYGLWGLLRPGPERSENPAQPPQLLVQAWIVDGETGQPVRSTVLLNGIKTLEEVDHFTIVVPKQAEGFHIEVRAEGYEPWGMRFRYSLKRGYLFKGPVRLKRSL